LTVLPFVRRLPKYFVGVGVASGVISFFVAFANLTQFLRSMTCLFCCARSRSQTLDHRTKAAGKAQGAGRKSARMILTASESEMWALRLFCQASQGVPEIFGTTQRTVNKAGGP
jgi:hypothetical protein